MASKFNKFTHVESMSLTGGIIALVLENRSSLKICFPEGSKNQQRESKINAYLVAYAEKYDLTADVVKPGYAYLRRRGEMREVVVSKDESFRLTAGIVDIVKRQMASLYEYLDDNAKETKINKINKIEEYLMAYAEAYDLTADIVKPGMAYKRSLDRKKGEGDDLPVSSPRLVVFHSSSAIPAPAGRVLSKRSVSLNPDPPDRRRVLSKRRFDDSDEDEVL